MNDFVISDALRVLCECDPTYRPEHTYEWCGRVRHDSYRIENDATNAEMMAARALTAKKQKRRKLVMALNALDGEGGRSIKEFSDLGQWKADRDDYRAVYPLVANDSRVRRAEFMERLDAAAEARHAEREKRAVEAMLAPVPRWNALRVRVVKALLEMGVKFDCEPMRMEADGRYVHMMYAGRDLAKLYLSWDMLRTRDQYPEHHRVKQKMIDAGLLAPMVTTV